MLALLARERERERTTLKAKRDPLFMGWRGREARSGENSVRKRKKEEEEEGKALSKTSLMRGRAFN